MAVGRKIIFGRRLRAELGHDIPTERVNSIEKTTKSERPKVRPLKRLRYLTAENNVEEIMDVI